MLIILRGIVQVDSLCEQRFAVLVRTHASTRIGDLGAPVVHGLG